MRTLDKSANISLEASAGTGKTFQLSMRVAAMLICGVPPKDILCLTFTNKATNEMLERVINLLDTLSNGTASATDTEIIEPVIKAYAERIKTEYSLTFLQKTAAEARERLFSEFSMLKIKTIEAFLNLILKIFPFEAELRPDYRICTDNEYNELLDETFYEMFYGLLEKEGWSQVFSKTDSAFETPAMNMVENIQRLASFSAKHRIELKNTLNMNILTPQEIELLLDKAIALKNEAINQLAIFKSDFDPETLNGKQIKTYNNLCKINRIRELINDKMISGTPSEHGFFKGYAFTDNQLLAHLTINKLITEYLRLKGDTAKALSLSLGRILYHKLKTAKSEKNLLTYSDIGERVYEMLVTDKPHINKEYLYFRLDGRVNHLLIDEFQDTSLTQWLILEPLAEEAMAGIGQGDKRGSFFYVGDPKQNLYRFRGSSSKLFRQVADYFDDRLERETLTTNYRSDSNIVEFANIIFNNVAGAYKRSELDIFKIEQKPRNTCLDGYVEVDYLPDKKEETFAEYTIKKVQKALDNGWSRGDIAVLLPTNSDGVKLKVEFANAEIPVKLETSRFLADTGVFKSIMALASFLETAAEFPFLEYALTERFAFGIDKYADIDTHIAIMKNILDTAQQGKALTIFEKLIRVIRETDMQKRFEREPDFIQTLDIIAATAPNEKNIEIFTDLVTKAAFNQASLTAEESDAVTVMTIHKSKGLQFPLVILPKLDIKFELDAKGSPFIITDSKEPGFGRLEYIHTKTAKPFLSMEQTEAIDYENTLVLQDCLNQLYVAVTRAEHALILAVPALKESKSDEDINNLSKLIPTLIDIPYEKGTLTPPPKILKQETPALLAIRSEPYDTGAKGDIKTIENKTFNATIFGTVFHLAAFLLNGFADDDINKAVEGALACDGAFLTESDIEDLKIYVSALAESEDWRELFNGTTFRERKVRYEGGINSIDFYSVLSDKVVLIDYKTGDIGSDAETEYKRQLDRYGVILEAMYKTPVDKYIYCFNKKKLFITKY